MSQIERIVNIVLNTEGVERVEKINKELEKVTKSTDRHTESTSRNRKSVLESGGAMGLLGAATGGLAMDFKDAIEAVGDFGIKLKGLGGIIAASVIGALAIVILQLVTNWDKWSGVIDGSTTALQNLRLEQERLNAEFETTKNNLETELEILRLKGAALGVIQTQEKLIFEAEQNRLADSYLSAKDELDIIKEKYDFLERISQGEFMSDSKLEAIREAERKVLKLEADMIKLNNQRYVDVTRDEEEQKAKIKLELEKQITDQKQRQEKLNAEIEKRLVRIGSLIASLYQDSKNNIREYDPLFENLSSRFQEIERIIEKSFSSTQGLSKIFDEIQELNAIIAKGGASDKNLDDRNKKLKEYTNLNIVYSESIELAKNKVTELQADTVADTEFLRYSNEVSSTLKAMTVDLNKVSIAMLEYEKTDTGLYSYFEKYQQQEERLNDIFNRRIEILKIEADFKKDSITSDISEKENQINEIDTAIDKKKKELEGLSNDNSNEGIDKATNITKELELLENAKLDIQEQGEKKRLELLKVDADLTLDITQETNDKELAIELNGWEKRREMREAELQHKRDIQQSALNLADAGLNLMGALENESKSSQKASIIATSAVGIGKMVISTLEANTAALATPQAIATSGASAAPVIAMNYLALASNTAANLLATNKALKSLGGGSADAGAGSQGASVPQAQFNIVGSSGNNQLASSIASRQNQPVRAFVVSTDITTQQALDRNIQGNATFL